MARSKEPRGQGCTKTLTKEIWTLQDSGMHWTGCILSELPMTMKVHNVFHIDLLTLYHKTESYGLNYVRPPPVTEGEEEEYEVESIRDARK